MSVPVFVHIKSFNDFRDSTKVFYKISDALSFVRSFRCNGHFITSSLRDELLCVNTDMHLNQDFTLLDDDFSSPWLKSSPLISVHVFNFTDFTTRRFYFKSIVQALDIVKSYPLQGHFVCATYNSQIVCFKSDLILESRYIFFNRQGRNKSFFI